MKPKENLCVEKLSDANTSMTLINLAKTKDQEAWGTLCILYTPLVCFWCRKFGVVSSDFDDVSQDVFRAVYLSLHKFDKTREQDSFRAWLWTITRNRIRDHFKKAKNKPIATGGTDIQILMHQVPDEEPAEIETAFEASGGLAHEALKIVRSEVKPQTFNAFWRSTIDDVAPAVVASELGISVDSVYQAKSRVLRRMRDLLE